MLSKKDYIEYLVSSPLNYTCSNLAEHKTKMSHDVVSNFLKHSRFTPRQLWTAVLPFIHNCAEGFLMVDDSVQDKRYSQFIELVKRQYSGNEHGLVRGINLVNLVHSSGQAGDFFPIDFRIYAPDQDGKSKNVHFQEMFTNARASKALLCRRILFDSWYASADNLKIIHRADWTFFTTLKSNRMVSLSKESGYVHLQEIAFDDPQLQCGIQVKLKEVPFLVRLFKIVASNGDIEWVITNDLTCMHAGVADQVNAERWRIEELHREYKQLTGSEKCQCRSQRAQRNHLACCYHAWLSLKIHAKKWHTTVYQLNKELLKPFLIQRLENPIVIGII